MANRNKPRPKNQRELEYEQIEPYAEAGLSKPVFKEFLRGEQTSRKGDNVKDYTIGLQDIDESIFYYFNNVIKPNVTKQGQRIAVPVIYGSPERWKAVQADGYYRNKDSKIMVPLIMFKRNGIEKSYDIGNKLDANHPHNFQVFQKTYSPKNQYDNFSILTNRIPTKELYGVIIPDYIKVTYECILFTDFVEDMNKLIEAINFSSDSYWGDKERFQFRTRIDSFDTITEVSQDSERAVKTNFNITLNGYIIPETINKELVSAQKFYSKSKIIFTLETSTNIDTLVVQNSLNNPQSTVIDTSGGGGGGGGGSIDPAVVTYLNWSKQLTGTFSNTTTITFASEWYVAPSPLPATSIDNFSFFCNGALIERSSIVSFTQLAGVSTLVIDASLLGYTFEAGDEVVGIGKFLNGDV